MSDKQHTRQTSMEEILFQYATYIWMYALKSGTPDEEREFYAITRLREFLYDSKLITEDEALKLAKVREDIKALQKDLAKTEWNSVKDLASSTNTIVSAWTGLADTLSDEDASPWEKIAAIWNAMTQTVDGFLRIIDAVNAWTEASETLQKAQAAEETGAGTAAERLTETVTAPLAETAVMKMEPIVVKEEDLREMLDAKPVRHDRVLAEKKPGIVTGLAWTAAGGEILFIETLFTKGSGKFTVTGQLGDVMKESVQIAVSLVKSMFPDKASLFEENDLHIHVPEGAVPKDGPSAGITMTTALASLVSDRAVAPTIAMTGEVSLRGVVTPIGGLPEKLMAASRAGIQTVFIPKENEDDLDEVPQEVRDKLTIIPVSDVTEVLEKTGILDGSEEKID